MDQPLKPSESDSLASEVVEVHTDKYGPIYELPNGDRARNVDVARQNELNAALRALNAVLGEAVRRADAGEDIPTRADGEIDLHRIRQEMNAELSISNAEDPADD